MSDQLTPEERKEAEDIVNMNQGFRSSRVITRLLAALDAADKRARLTGGEAALVAHVRTRMETVGKTLPMERALLAIIDRLTEGQP